jgi:TP53 regulating kinase-like protein
LGENIAVLHQNDIIHGDLTTSNMILKNNKIYFIDFGLGFQSARIEDKAVDLHLLRQALESKHFKHWQTLFDAVLLGYKKLGNEAVLLQLKKVESRGRYKNQH